MVGVVVVGLKKLLRVGVGGSVVVSTVVVVSVVGSAVVVIEKRLVKGAAVVGAWNGNMVVLSSSNA